MDDYTFLWKGRDPDGNPGSTRLAAENAQAARERLTLAGWTELELVEDEVASVSSKFVDQPPEFEEVSAAESVKYFEGTAPGFFAHWWALLWQAKVTLLIFGSILVLGILAQRVWAIILG